MRVLPVETQQACCPLRLRSVSSYGQRAASSSSSSSLFSSPHHPPGWCGPRVDGQHVYSSSFHSNMLVKGNGRYCEIKWILILIHSLQEKHADGGYVLSGVIWKHKRKCNGLSVAIKLHQFFKSQNCSAAESKHINKSVTSVGSAVQMEEATHSDTYFQPAIPAYIFKPIHTLALCFTEFCIH